ncbi:transcriptional repressor LexA [bacterium]|nr:transcriptional repressor LexA [bacterium]
MIKKLLTTRQQEVLDFIIASKKEIGYPPSIKEIAEYFGFSSLTTASDHLNALIRKGVIHKNKGARKLMIDPKYQPKKNNSENKCVNIPLIGEIAAGKPILATENIEDSFLIDKNLINNEKTFLLKVCGNSMIDAHIQDGDLIIIQSQNYAQQDDIVVALIGNEATVKRLIKKENKVFLKPENSSMKPIDISNLDEPVRIAGKVIGVFRTLN